MIEMQSNVERDTPHAAQWLDALSQKPSGGVEHFVAEAVSAAGEYDRLGCTMVDLQPGDSTRYVMYLLDRYAHAAEAGRVLGGKEKTMLVAMPLWSEGGRSYVFSSNGFHVPSYVGQKLRLDEHSTVVMAAFLTLFSAALTDLVAHG